MNKFILLLACLLCFGVGGAAAQTAPDYKISKIKIVPFEQATGEFEAEYPSGGDDRAFFNDLGKGLFVTVELTGKAGSFEAKRSVDVSVTEGKIIKLKKIFMPGVFNENGKYFVAFWLEPAMCSTVTVSARITNQRNASPMKRIIPFMCGE